MSDCIRFKALVLGGNHMKRDQGYDTPEEAKTEVFRQFDEWRASRGPKILGIDWGRKQGFGYMVEDWDYWFIAVLYE